MSNKLFSAKEIKHLVANRYVKTVSAKGITYTDEFKRIFIAEYEKGKLPRCIFEDCGFSIEIIGVQRVKSAATRWRAAYNKAGVEGLQDTRKVNTGRPSDKSLSVEEKYKRLHAQNNLLKAENELLKKIDLLERGVKRV